MAKKDKDNQVSDKTKGNASELLQIIPGIGFDIICRIVPGIIIILAVYMVVDKCAFEMLGKQRIGSLISGASELGWGHLVIGSVLAYFVGSIVDYFANYVLHWPTIWVGWMVITTNINTEKTKDANGKKISAESERLPQIAGQKSLPQLKWSLEWKEVKTTLERIQSILETLRTKYSEPGTSRNAVLAKLIAEERLAKNMLVVVPLIIILSVCWNSDVYWGHLLDLEVGTATMIVLLVLLAASWDRTKRSVARPFFWWRKDEQASKKEELL